MEESLIPKNHITKAIISPLVPSIILDYYLRNIDKDFVVGTLLGKGNEITNCFGVPLEVKPKNDKTYYVRPVVLISLDL